MFVQLRDRQALGVTPDQVVAIIESINAPNIAVPERGTEPTKAYIVGVRLPTQTFAIFLYLHMLDSGQAAIFVTDPVEVPLETYPMLEAQAIHYVESMGFMLDNLNFRARAPDEQIALVQTLPIFMAQPPRSELRPDLGRALQTPPGGEARIPPGYAAPSYGSPTGNGDVSPLARLLAAF